MNQLLFPPDKNPIMDRPVLLPVHDHPLIPSARIVNDQCYFCLKEGHIYGGYYCAECCQWFHEECAEAPLEIIHPSHPQHPLTLTFTDDDRKCGLCGLTGWCRGYACFLMCDFEMDLACARKSPPLLATELFIGKEQKTVPRCGECEDYSECDPTLFHVGCANLPQEVNHFCHLRHPLILVTSKSLFNVLDKTCLLCGQASDEALYHCSTCNFTLCPFCGKNPPPFTVEHLKTHSHQLTLWPRHITFTCNVCGLQGDRSPYLCYLCDIMIHRECFGLPRIININRHDHRLSLTNRVGLAYVKCGVCRKSVNQYYGGYSCTTCPSYVVHPQCAMRRGVWDMIELEGTPEDEIIPPYTVVGDGLIQHFSHENHYLRLNKDDTVIPDDSSRCEACGLPVFSDPVYSCERCDFVLHETCANFPMKKRLLFATKTYTLNAGIYVCNCRLCGIIFSGFWYKNGGGHPDLDHIRGSFSEPFHSDIDVRCGSFSEPFSFDGHSHSLYYKQRDGGICVACPRKEEVLLSCDDCDYQVHLGCANLPKRVKHTSDDHHLTLCYGEEETIGTYWCDICERETDPKKWFYTCSHCGVTLHTGCVLGDFSRLMANQVISSDVRFEVIRNDKIDRPFCRVCTFRSIGPFILKFCDPHKGCICSAGCLRLFRSRPWKYIQNHFTFPQLVV